MSEVIRVVLADDHIVMLEGLGILLDSEPDIQVIDLVSSGEALLSTLEQNEIDVIVIDLDMPGLSGMESISLVRKQYDSVRILVLTAFSDRQNLQHAIERGVEGYALKTESPRQLIQAIKQVAEGRLVFPQVAQSLLTNPPASNKSSRVALSEREIQVLECVAQGYANSQIASQLHISANTVRFHLKNIFSKLEVSNRTEAAMWYHDNN